MHYFVLKCGQVGGMILMPILREDFKCLNKNDCYPLAFGVSTVFMMIAVMTLWIGRREYVHVPPSGNMLMKTLRCVQYSLAMRFKTKKNGNKSHWLDWSEEKYGPKLVRDTKIILNVLVLYLPLPFYWSLIQQQNSKWIFQAARMNGNIGWYTIKPDQMVVLGPLLITFMIPIFNEIFFPLLEKIGIKSPLQKMSCGMICAALSFVMSAYVEMQLAHSKLSIMW
jgi:solute carrier family 15 (oligopeptide transporter), member 1